MANISQAMTKSLLDWSLAQGSAPTRPVGCFAGLALGAPSSISSSEVATGSGYVRQTMIFGAAGTPLSSGTATNNAAVTFGPFSSIQSITGVFLSDTVSSAAGTMLYFGNLAAARTVSPADTLVFASAALTITLN